ncbi:MAG TPA: hypothetical protein PK208_08360 [Fibrobacteria bacterium]|nr:hypothetical protein [Fibrobacteria bacterium]
MDCDIDSQTPESRPAASRGGFAMFGVLVLVVIFTLLGVGALTLAQRDSRNSGSLLDIKSRQSAAYAGLAFALGEFQRDPANFVALLESWRTKSVYGGLTNPLPKLYFKFDAAGAATTLVKTKPAPFAIAGTPYKVVVELAGIQVPATNTEDPVIVLRSTGAGRSGDEQTIVGAYRVGNVRLNVATANLGITHPFYLNGTGIWNNKITASGGDVFFGNTTHLNSSSQELVVTNGGLRVNGNLTWDVGKNFDIAGNSWISGNVSVKDVDGQILFRKNLVVGGNLAYSRAAQVDVEGSLEVRGAAGIELKSGTLNVGAGIPGSQLLVDPGATQDATGGGRLNVVGKAYLAKIGDGSKAWTLNAGRLELANNPTVIQRFVGNGTWGRLVARNCAATSALWPGVSGAITISKNSWLENSANLSLGTAGLMFTQGAGSRLYFSPWPTCFGCAGVATTTAGAPLAGDSISTVAYSGAGVNGRGFDAAFPPKTLVDLGYGSSTPATETEIGFDISLDPSIQSRAFVPAGSGGRCQDNAKLCGAYIQAEYSNSANAGCFFNGFFVVLLNGTRPFTWDASATQTTPLAGKYLFIVTGPTGGNPWPTTAPNADPSNPTNVQFIYVRSTGKVFPSFSPRYKNNTVDPVTFHGYVRIDHPGTSGTSWDLTNPMDFQGAVHVVGDRTNVNLTVNSSSTGTAQFNLNQNVLSVIGNAFGTVFTNPTTGAPLVNPALAGFKAVENWIQFTPLAELR